jgi:protein transport protein SEC20
MKPSETPQGGETVSEQVGRVIDDSQNNQRTGQEAVEDPVEEVTESPEEEQAEAHRNPKKRMWEEDKEAAKEAQRAKDEL